MERAIKARDTNKTSVKDKNTSERAALPSRGGAVTLLALKPPGPPRPGGFNDFRRQVDHALVESGQWLLLHGSRGTASRVDGAQAPEWVAAHPQKGDSGAAQSFHCRWSVE